MLYEPSELRVTPSSVRYRALGLRVKRTANSQPPSRPNKPFTRRTPSPYADDVFREAMRPVGAGPGPPPLSPYVAQLLKNVTPPTAYTNGRHVPSVAKNSGPTWKNDMLWYREL